MRERLSERFSIRMQVPPTLLDTKTGGKLSSMNKYFILVLLVVLVPGCTHRLEPGFQRGQGDVRDFILSEAIQRGGTPVTTNDLPIVPGQWRYERDEFGVVIRLPRHTYELVEDFMLMAFGQPKIGPSETPEGGMFGAYRLTARGGGLLSAMTRNKPR